MSKYSEYLKAQKAKQIEWFFGEITKKSNKYFTFNRYIDEDNAIIVTNNIIHIKDNPVLVVGSNKVVYLKDWQFLAVRNFYEGYEGYVVKLNRKYFKKYTFKKDFEDFIGMDELEFDDVLKIAHEQDDRNMQIALGHCG